MLLVLLKFKSIKRLCTSHNHYSKHAFRIVLKIIQIWEDKPPEEFKTAAATENREQNSAFSPCATS